MVSESSQDYRISRTEMLLSKGELVQGPRTMMPKVLNGSSVTLTGRIDDQDLSYVAAIEKNEKDDLSGVELCGGNDQQESKSQSLQRTSNSSQTKNCKRLWTSTQNNGQDEDVAPSMKIDDATETANSSVWSTLGIKNEKIRSFVGFYQVLDSNSKRGRFMNGGAAMAVLMANPAALSRSVNFHESI